MIYNTKSRNKGLWGGEADMGQNQRRQSKQANKSDKEQAKIKNPIHSQGPKQANNRSQSRIQRLESRMKPKNLTKNNEN